VDKLQQHKNGAAVDNVKPVIEKIFYFCLNGCKQGCGSGSGFSDFVEPDPDPYWESGSGSRGKKMKKFQWKNALFSYLKQKFCYHYKGIKYFIYTLYFFKKNFMNNAGIFYLI
jgi:hypothetical protein